MVRFISDDSDANLSARGPQMQVISAGLSRSATSSLQAALESDAMGFSPCMHMAHIAPHATRAQIIIDAMQEEDTKLRQKMLHQIFDGYTATTDFPGWWFLEDLMDMYPDAPIVLNQRKGGAAPWIKSFEGSLSFFTSWQYYAACFPYKTDRLHWTIHQIAARQTKQRWGAGISAEFYDAYQEWVIKVAEKRGRKLLIWKAEDGWEPLCKFLGKEAPKDTPFPWVNDAAAITMLKRILVARGLLTWAAMIGGAYATWRFWPNMLTSISNIKGSWM